MVLDQGEWEPRPQSPDRPPIVQESLDQEVDQDHNGSYALGFHSQKDHLVQYRSFVWVMGGLASAVCLVVAVVKGFSIAAAAAAAVGWQARSLHF